MQHGRLLTAAGLFFLFVNIPIASANITNLSTNPEFAKTFSFYCAPYVASFDAHKHYIVKDGQCVYSIPSTLTGTKQLLLMKGVPGVGASIVGGDTVGFSTTLVAQYPNSFGGAVDEDGFFAAVYETALDQGATPFIHYLSGATTTIPAAAVEGQNYYLLPWVWGPKPASEFDPVVVVPGILGSWQKDNEWLLDPILHTYDNLLDTLRANGYVDGQTLFPFGYDWEHTNIDTAYQLGQKIKEVKVACSCDQVDVIAHSMGGLAAEYYIESPDYGHDIDQLVLLAVPQGGAPLAYKAWEGGEFDLGDPVYNFFSQIKFYLEARTAGYSSIFDYIRGNPINSVQELLPNYSYLRTATTTLQYPNGYPVNGFMEDLQNNLPLKYWGGSFSLDGARITVVTASGQDTQVGYIVSYTGSQKWQHGEPTADIIGNGDGTVPQESLESFFPSDKDFPGDDHNSVASSSAEFIFETFNNRTPDTIVGKTYNSVTSFLYLQLLSPVDMQITTPDGRRIGKDFSNTTELSETPDAFYSGFNTDNEYAIIPNPLPGEYKVETVGTGSGGEYTIVASYSDLATTTQTEVTGSTVAGEVVDHTLTLSPTTTAVTITADAPPTEVTPEKCAEDVETAYHNHWIKKRSIYMRLSQDCHLLGRLIETRDTMEERQDGHDNGNHEKHSTWFSKGISKSIKAVLDRMERLVNDKSNTQEAKDLIIQDIVWFREQI